MYRLQRHTVISSSGNDLTRKNAQRAKNDKQLNQTFTSVQQKTGHLNRTKKFIKNDLIDKLTKFTQLTLKALIRPQLYYIKVLKVKIQYLIIARRNRAF